MRASAVSFIHKLTAAALAALLTLSLAPTAYAEGESSSDDGSGVVASALADQQNDSTDSSGESQEVSAKQDAEGSLVAPMLASGLVGKPCNFINSDVALDSEPIIGSFTVDGLTYAVIDGPYVELVDVSPGWQQVTNSQEGEGSSVASGLPDPVILSEGSEAVGVEESNEDYASEAGSTNLTLPETVSYAGVSHIVSSVGSYAFYLSGVASVTLPASVSDVDDRAFRSSDVASVTVAEGNPTFSSFDGVLYDAPQSSLLLIPEGKQGAVLLPKTAEVAEASVFSHCPLVDSISVEKDGAAFASENGLLYTSDLATLLRVPAGATEITIREGCTTIAAGALEACAKLERINAPASVTSISPDIFHAIPTVSLPAASLAEDTSQLSAMVALSSIDDCFNEVSPEAITTILLMGTNASPWTDIGLTVSWENGAKTEGDSSPNVAMQDSMTPTANISSFNSSRATTATGRLLCSFVYSASHVSRVDWTTYDKVIRNGTQSVRKRESGSFPSGGDTLYTWLIWTTGGDSIDIYWSDRVSGGVGYQDFSTWKAIPNTGYRISGWKWGGQTIVSSGFYPTNQGVYLSPIAVANTYTVLLNAQGGAVSQTSFAATYDKDLTLPNAQRVGSRFLGWNTEADGTGTWYQAGTVRNLSATHGAQVTLYAQWMSYSIDFDVDLEPGDEDYPGIDKAPITGEEIEVAGDKVEIEDPKRPGYVFQGWTIPNAEGTEAIDQDLVYQGDDGKWYVDASKLPDYAGDDGRVELTARWTSVISVDVPSSVTFYADVVTQGNESREGLASSAFGQNKVQSQSEVDLRIVGLESKQVKGNGSTSLGASDILKKKDGSALPTTSDKLFSLYPATGELKEDDLKDPDATSASKPEGAVDFSLDDILLEKSFAADEFTIPAGDTLSLGYRLNLQETDTELDYDKLSTLSEGASASIANISYCFAADALPSDWGEPLWIENPDQSANPAKYLLLDDIKAAADDLSANGTSSAYYSMYKSMLDSQVTDNGNPGSGSYFQLKVGNAYIDLQLIGICQDTKSSGGKAGLTFQTRNIYAYSNKVSSAAGGGAFPSYMNEESDSSSGWKGSAMRERLSGKKADGTASSMEPIFWSKLPAATRVAIVGVDKHQQLPSGTTASFLQKTTSETIWLPSMHEVFGTISTNFNESEGLTTVVGYTPFQYMAYQPGGTSTTNTHAIKAYNGSASYWWLRTARRSSTDIFCTVGPHGDRNSSYANITRGAAPCFCL